MLKSARQHSLQLYKENQIFQIFSAMLIVFNFFIWFRKQDIPILFYYGAYGKYNNRFIPEEAINELHLPVNTRSYIPCYHPKSEVTCQQVQHAWNVVKRWRDDQARANYTLNDPKIVHVMPHCGSANQIFHILAGGLMSIYFNRTYFINRRPQGYHLDDNIIHYHEKICTGRFRHIALINETNWDKYGARNLRKMNTSHYVIYATLQTRFFTIDGIGQFNYNNFGEHFVYFLANYFIRFDQDIIKHVQEFFASVPKATRIFGVHLRYQNGMAVFIGKNPNHCFSVVLPFLKREYKRKPTVIALATDGNIIRRGFIKGLDPIPVMTLYPLNGTNYGMNDMVMLLNTDDLLGTYRSTFTYLSHALTMRRPYYYNCKHDYLVQFTFSQQAIVSIENEYGFKVFSKQTNQYNRIQDNNEMLLRRFFKHQIL